MTAPGMMMPEFNVNTPAEWPSWLGRFNNLMRSEDITAPGRKCAKLLHMAGQEVYDLVQTFPTVAGDENEYMKTTKQLTDYFVSKRNKIFERDKFRQARQNAGEPIQLYLTRLRKLAATCDFHNPDEEILQQLVSCGSNSRVREKALQQEMSLQQLFEYALSLERSRQMEKRHNKAPGSQMHVNAQRPALPPKKSSDGESTNKQTNKADACYRCRSTKHFAHTCPFKEKDCSFCGKRGHGEKACRLKDSNHQSHREEAGSSSQDKGKTAFRGRSG